MYEPEFTVITPTSNIVDAGLTDDFSLLVNLLDRQTYPYIEHIIVDNASSDETITLLKDYKNNGFLNFYSEPDRGKFDAMNKGIMHAKGKYIAFLSCDDFYHDVVAVADIVDAMERENADYCFFPAYCCHPEGFVFLFPPSMLSTFQVNPCARQAMVFKRSVLDQLRMFDDKFKLMADYDLMIRLVMGKYKGLYFERNVLTYKLGQESIKHSTQMEAECRHIFYKNYKSLYPMTDEVLDRMVKISEVPKPLLDKLVTYFTPEDRDNFYQVAQNLYDMRVRAVNEMGNQNR